jgi:hypothetical protein
VKIIPTRLIIFHLVEQQKSQSTMRKAISRKGTRRKHDDKSQALSPTNSVGTDGTDISKRKVSEGEAVLTAKNYRLAKELVGSNSVFLF